MKQNPVLVNDLQHKKTAELIPYVNNSRTHTDKQINQVASSIKEFGFLIPVLIDSTGMIIAGHCRVAAAQRLKLDTVPCIVADHLNELQIKAYVIADNKLAENSAWDEDLLKLELTNLNENGFDIDLLGFSSEEKDFLLADIEYSLGEELNNKGSLQSNFLAPPFSVLDAKQGYWQDRKRDWLALGIKSDDGRDAECLPNSLGEKYGRKESTGVSVFDPVLCEVAYRWFTPVGGLVLDPFAGGSVRGIVAAKIGRQYIGIDLRSEQIEANRAQWERISQKLEVNSAATRPEVLFNNTPDLTPIEQVGEYWFKRDDHFIIEGSCGGKVRSCWALAQGSIGLITAGSRASPQVNIVASIAKKLGIPCRAHTPQGQLSPELLSAKNSGAEIIQHKAGYNNVIIARANEDAQNLGWTNIPFGMQCDEAIKQTRAQVKNIPKGIKRIVIPVGSGMSLAGILHGLNDQGLNIPVIGVQVGAVPIKRLDQYAPKDWRKMVTLVKSPLDYHKEVKNNLFCGIELDPVYEAKCIEFIEPGDLLWIVGKRATCTSTALTESIIEPVWTCGDSRNIQSIANGVEADFIFTCPPYADLEVYSDDPSDISNLAYEEFIPAYNDIINKTCAMLKDDRFACFVVGDIRDKKGLYRNFVSDTITAFLSAGLSLYNEAIFVTPIGTLPVRAANGFRASRKLGKAHQNVLIFVKGCPKKATEYCGDVEVMMIDGGEEA